MDFVYNPNPTFSQVYGKYIDYRTSKLAEIKQYLAQQQAGTASERTAMLATLRAEFQMASDLQLALQKSTDQRIASSQAIQERIAAAAGTSESARLQLLGTMYKADRDLAIAASNAVGADSRAASETAANVVESAYKDPSVVSAAQSTDPNTQRLAVQNIITTKVRGAYETADNLGKAEILRGLNTQLGSLSAQPQWQQNVASVLSGSLGPAPTDTDLARLRSNTGASALANMASAGGGGGGGGGVNIGGAFTSPTQEWQILGLPNEDALSAYTRQAAFNRLRIEQPEILSANGVKSVQDWDAAVAKEAGKGPLSMEVSRMASAPWESKVTYGDPRWAQQALEVQAAQTKANTDMASFAGKSRLTYPELLDQARNIFTQEYGSPKEKARMASANTDWQNRIDVAHQLKNPVTASAILHGNPGGDTRPEDAVDAAAWDQLEQARNPGPTPADPTTTQEISPEAFAYLQDAKVLNPIHPDLQPQPGIITDYMANGVRVREAGSIKEGSNPLPALEREAEHATATPTTPAAPQRTDQSNVPMPIRHMPQVLGYIDHDTGETQVKWEQLSHDQQAALLQTAKDTLTDYKDHIEAWKAGKPSDFSPDEIAQAGDVLHTAQILYDIGVPSVGDLPTWDAVLADKKLLEANTPTQVPDPSAPEPLDMGGESFEVKAPKPTSPNATPSTPDLPEAAKGGPDNKKLPSPTTQAEMETVKAATQGATIASVSKATKVDPLQQIKQMNGRVALTKREIQLLADLASRANVPEGKDLIASLAAITGSSRWLNDQIRNQAKTYFTAQVSLKTGDQH